MTKFKGCTAIKCTCLMNTTVNIVAIKSVGYFHEGLETMFVILKPVFLWHHQHI